MPVVGQHFGAGADANEYEITRNPEVLRGERLVAALAFRHVGQREPERFLARAVEPAGVGADFVAELFELLAGARLLRGKTPEVERVAAHVVEDAAHLGERRGRRETPALGPVVLRSAVRVEAGTGLVTETAVNGFGREPETAGVVHKGVAGLLGVVDRKDFTGVQVTVAVGIAPEPAVGRRRMLRRRARLTFAEVQQQRGNRDLAVVFKTKRPRRSGGRSRLSFSPTGADLRDTARGPS